MKINVLSCFDGISAGQLALQRANINVKNYYASEIDKYAIQITQKNFPDTIQLGDVTDWKKWDLPKINLIMGGSPCQGFSNSGEGKNFEDPRSKLFFTFLDILEHYTPKYFLLENVKMKKEWVKRITKEIGVEPILINSALVSAQNRQRFYWTNIPNVIQPEDKNIFLKDILLNDTEAVVLHNIYGGFNEKVPRVSTEKSPTIRTARGGGHIPSVAKTFSFDRINGIKKELEKAVPICASDWRGLNRNQTQNCLVDLDKLSEIKEIANRGCAMRTRRKDDGKNIDWHDSDKENSEQYVELRKDNKANCLTSVRKDSLVITDKALEYMNRKVADGRNHWDFARHSDIEKDKSATVVANFFKGVPYNVLKDWDCIRKFHPIECERLQNFPDNYTEGISNTQRYKGLGNSWTVDVVKHIFDFLPEDFKGE